MQRLSTVHLAAVLLFLLPGVGTTAAARTYCPTETVSGALDGSDQIFDRPVMVVDSCSPTGAGPAYHYDSFDFHLTGPVWHDLQANLCSPDGTADFDTVIAIYQHPYGDPQPFDPLHPCTNLIAWNDDFCGLHSALSETNLVAGQVTVVMTSFDPGGTGSYSLAVGSTSCDDDGEFECNVAVGFDSPPGPPAGWSVVDNAASGVAWTDIDQAGELGNYTGGSGNAATVSSVAVGPAAFDTELRTPLFDIPETGATLVYKANYRNLDNDDFLDLDISTNGGRSWTTLLSWDDDHGGFRASPGREVVVDLTAYAGQQDLMLRWHFYNAEPGDNAAWYAQIDDVELMCDVPTIFVNPGGLVAGQAPETTELHPFVIGNVGGTELVWQLDDALAPRAARGERPPRVDRYRAGAKRDTADGRDDGARESRARTTAVVAEDRHAALIDEVSTLDSGTNILRDGGLESGQYGGTWAESSINFGTPICSVDLCGSGTGTGPVNGEYWAWFGGIHPGIASYEESSLAQTLIIPKAPRAILSFYLEQILCDSAYDYLELLIDSTRVWFTDGSSNRCGELGYTLQEVDVTPFADGEEHTIAFHAEVFITNGGITNFFVDDVALMVEGGEATCSSPTDIPWLSVLPPAGATPPDSVSEIVITTDSSGMPPGVFESTLCISSNDPNRPVVPVAVRVGVCPDQLLISDLALAGTLEVKAMTSITVGPDVLIDGISVDLIAGQRLVVTDGVEINGGFRAIIRSVPCP